MDKLAWALLLPFIVWMLVLGWIVYASRGRRTVKLDLRGLGLQMRIESSEHVSTSSTEEN